MEQEKFAISADGQVYRRDGHHWEHVGRLASVLHEASARGRDLREWWHDRLASDEPGENIVIVAKSDPVFMPSRDRIPFDGFSPDQALPEVAFATNQPEPSPTFVFQETSNE